MSERGSFCTEYIYCRPCLEVAKAVLVADDKFLKGVVIPGWQGHADLPIVAGKIGGLSSGEEIWDFASSYGEEIAAEICHEMRIAVMADSGGSQIFVLRPGGIVDTLLPHE